MEKKPTSSINAGSLGKLKLLFTVIDRAKSEFFTDVLTGFDSNLQLTLPAHGTAKTELLELLGLEDNAKTVLVSVIREDRAAPALAALEKKFKTVRGANGIAFTVSMNSVIGVAVYQYLSGLSGRD